MENQQDPDVRWKQRLSSFRKAFRQVRDAAHLASERSLSELEKQGLIQAFEFTHELAWKVMKDFLQAHGSTSEIFGSKDATREAFATGLITDGEVWMAMIRSRNLSSHTYNESTAEEIVSAVIKNYVPLLERFQEELTEREAKGA